MLYIKLGKNTNIRHFLKFSSLYQKVIIALKLYDFVIEVKYILPENNAALLKMTEHSDGISIHATILDYNRLDTHHRSFDMPNLTGISKNFAVDTMNNIYNNIKLHKYNYNFTKQDMLQLNQVNDILKRL